MVDELTEFIKTERECCDFFTFNLAISGDKREVWLELTFETLTLLRITQLKQLMQ